LTSVWLYRVLSALQPSDVINTVPTDRGKLVTLVAGSSKRRSLLMVGTVDKVFMTRSLNVTPKTAKEHLILLSGKSETEVTV